VVQGARERAREGGGAGRWCREQEKELGREVVQGARERAREGGGAGSMGKSEGGRVEEGKRGRLGSSK
jgi:hypothetical protein